MKKQHLIYTALSVSALLNAFLLGLTLSHAMPRHPFPGMHHDGPAAMAGALDVLDQPYRDQIAAILKDRQGAIDEDMQKMHDLFDRLPILLDSPTFDPAQMQTLDTALADQDRRLKSDVSAMVLDIATKLPDNERIKFFTKAMPPHAAGFRHSKDFSPPK